MPAAALLCLVVAISDGDTLTARCGEPGAYQQVKVRLSAIDAPESKQSFGQRSKQALTVLCARQQAKIQPVAKDRYGRTVADVECQGRDAGQAQVQAGMAWVYTRFAPKDSPLFALEDVARIHRMGLWSEQEPTPPWLFRQQKRVQHTGAGL